MSSDDISGGKIVVSKVLIRNDDGEFLVVKEHEEQEKDEAGKWELPGGRMKYGESRFEAAEREMLEEVGVEVSDPEDVVRIEVESDHLVNCYIIYFHEWSGEPEIQNENHFSELKWVTAEEFIGMDWHSNAGYDIVPMKDLDKYLDEDKIY